MFYTEEDVQPAVDMATELFGKVGNISNERTSIKNVIITSDKFGHLWYGDIEDTMESVSAKCTTLSQKFDLKVFSISMT
jgi:hypothetical protein